MIGNKLKIRANTLGSSMYLRFYNKSGTLLSTTAVAKGKTIVEKVITIPANAIKLEIWIDESNTSRSGSVYEIFPVI